MEKKNILIIGGGDLSHLAIAAELAKAHNVVVINSAMEYGKNIAHLDEVNHKIKSICGEGFLVWNDPEFTLKALQIGIDMEKLKGFENDTDIFLETGNIDLERLKELILIGHRDIALRKPFDIKIEALPELSCHPIGRDFNFEPKVEQFTNRNLGSKVGGRKHKKNPFRYR